VNTPDIIKKLEEIVARPENVYRDGRHYVPVFVPDDLSTLKEAVKLIERQREALEAFSLSGPDADGFEWAHFNNGRCVGAIKDDPPFWLNCSDAIVDLMAEVTRLDREKAEARGKALELDALLKMVPQRPNAITYEHGWKILDALQAIAEKR
jgi:hypothetical protein